MVKTNRKYSLKELRARDDKTQEQVANDLNISVQTYNAWENNPGMIKLSNAILVCEYYMVSLAEIKV